MIPVLVGHYNGLPLLKNQTREKLVDCVMSLGSSIYLKNTIAYTYRISPRYYNPGRSL